ncbi:MAG: right-handed parallel beta-helix repeat-containing protein [Victivallales bacterium]
MRLLKSSFLLIIFHAFIFNAFTAAAAEKAPAVVVETHKTYYVSESGHDANSGQSREKPFRSIQRAADLTKPGDMVYIMNGIYTKDEPTSNILTITRSGRDDAYITYQALPGHTPKLKSKNWNAIKVEGASYIVIDGLELEGNADNIKLEYALAQKGNRNNPATSGNGVSICEKAEQKPHHIVVSNCRIYKFCGGGITSRHADYLTFEGNTIYENTFYSPYANSGISTYQDWNSDGNPGCKMIIRRNIIRHNQNRVPSFAAGGITDGNGIVIEDLRNTQNNSKLGAYKGRTLIENNVVYCNGGRGIHVFHSDGVDIVNNTLYRNSQDPRIPEGEISLMWGNDARVLNNIVYASNEKPANTVHESKWTVLDYNLSFNGNFSGAGEHNIIDKNPLFTDEAKFDFTLQKKSPAINAGTSELRITKDILNMPRPQGRAVDIGAYERKN